MAASSCSRPGAGLASALGAGVAAFGVGAPGLGGCFCAHAEGDAANHTTSASVARTARCIVASFRYEKVSALILPISANSRNWPAKPDDASTPRDLSLIRGAAHGVQPGSFPAARS